MYLTLSLISLLLLLLLLLWSFRNRLVEFLPTYVSARMRRYAPLNTFESAMEHGFSSINFDLSGNLGSSSSPGGAGGTGGGGETAADRDARTGLDERTLTEVRRIMDRQRVGFDEARRIYVERMFRKNGIDPNGYPIDPKAITSLA